MKKKTKDAATKVKEEEKLAKPVFRMAWDGLVASNRAKDIQIVERGESFYQDMMTKVVKEFEDKGQCAAGQRSQHDSWTLVFSL